MLFTHTRIHLYIEQEQKKTTRAKHTKLILPKNNHSFNTNNRHIFFCVCTLFVSSMTFNDDEDDDDDD